MSVFSGALGSSARQIENDWAEISIDLARAGGRRVLFSKMQSRCVEKETGVVAKISVS
jgi:hypothetical protein